MIRKLRKSCETTAPRPGLVLVGAMVLASLGSMGAAWAGSAEFTAPFGNSWDGVSLQDVLDAEYGVGVIDAANDYLGADPSDPDPVFWRDSGVGGVVLKEIAGYSKQNILGWYMEDFSGAPIIDGVNDGVVFTGFNYEGNVTEVYFPSGIINFSFYMNPNGVLDSHNAPEPELFFCNRAYNDVGPDGSGAIHEPLDGDPQCLVYDISHLRRGVATYVLAWEDLDYGGEVTASYDPNGTDNDFQDLVIEISPITHVPTANSNWGAIKALYTD